MSGKCKNCGSTDIETDPSRGDAVCTICGVVLEDQVIVNDNEFVEGPQGNINIVGQFVSSEASGGVSMRLGAGYHFSTKSSRENTINNARKGIKHLCMQLNFKHQYIDQAVGYYRLALEKNLTIGRKQELSYAACIYLTCRTAGTEHLLIDISDVLQINVHELGRAYLRFSQALCIKPPSIDPCLYVMRFANQLQFGDQTHAVTQTALRVVARMKTDSIHIGRRPSGVCGAALLIAARLHEFNRSIGDIVKIVKIHATTLRKRLIEFGETPSSALTLEEFMTVDLEEHQDPPSFKAAKNKNRENIDQMQNMDQEFLELRTEIDRLLDLPKYSKKKHGDESEEFIRDSNFTALQGCVESDDGNSLDEAIRKAMDNDIPIELGPNLTIMGLTNKPSNKDKENQHFENETGEITLSDIDDDELDRYIMSIKEVRDKSSMWVKKNEKYLEEQKEKEEKRKKALEEGKPEKKRKKVRKSKNQPPANNAGEAIEKMLQEKKISSKINYDVLKSLNIGTNNSTQEPETTPETVDEPEHSSENKPSPFTKVPAIPKRPAVNTKSSRTPNLVVKRKLNDDEPSQEAKKPMIEENPSELNASDDLVYDEDEDVEEEEVEDEDEVEPEPGAISVRDMLLARNAEFKSYGYGDYDEDDY